MKCNQVYPYVVSEVSYASVEEHLKECKTCSDNLENVNRIMSALDRKVEVPEGIVNKTLQRKLTLAFPAKPGIDFSKYLQIAAVLAAGIFLGIVLGRNANNELFVSKKHKKDKALMELRESHLLDNQSSFYRL